MNISDINIHDCNYCTLFYYKNKLINLFTYKNIPIIGQVFIIKNKMFVVYSTVEVMPNNNVEVILKRMRLK